MSLNLIIVYYYWICVKNWNKNYLLWVVLKEKFWGENASASRLLSDLVFFL